MIFILQALLNTSFSQMQITLIFTHYSQKQWRHGHHKIYSLQTIILKQTLIMIIIMIVVFLRICSKNLAAVCNVLNFPILWHDLWLSKVVKIPTPVHSLDEWCFCGKYHIASCVYAEKSDFKLCNAYISIAKINNYRWFVGKQKSCIHIFKIEWLN